MMPPEEYDQARRDAELHVQLELEQVETPASTPGPVKVTGRVVRVFRGAPTLLGTRIFTQIDCVSDDDHEQPDPGGEFWTPSADVRVGRVLEAFLNRHQHGHHIALWQSEVLDAATDQPVMTTPAIATVARSASLKLALLGAAAVMLVGLVLWATLH